jgi:pantoate--beta-alanine ligase
MPPLDQTMDAISKRIAGWRAAGSRIALVPTMGALHEGHIALVEEARQLAERVVVSIFVNPTQFAATEDFPSYPRDLYGDLTRLGDLADSVFAPSVEEMYPSGFATSIRIAGPAVGLETDFRPDHFAGVATIVAKLLLVVGPNVAVFGEKDYQQLLVIKRLVADLGLAVDIAAVPTVREEDGLARSSRNAYLSPEERVAAPQLYAAIDRAASAIAAGELAMTAIEGAREALRQAGFDLDYLELRDAETLAPVTRQTTEPMRILVAARLGHTRLIDNVPVPAG